MQSLPSHKRNKGDTANVSTQSVPGWKHALKTGSSLQKVRVYQPPESGSVQKHARPLASFFRPGKASSPRVTIARIESISMIYTSSIRQPKLGQAQELDTRTSLVRVVQDTLR
jgi:hypothetical protein